MRDEDEIQEMADTAASILNNGRLDDPHDKQTIIFEDKAHDVEYLRGIRDALDWALDEDIEDAPL